jgi:dTDP-4-amino-4,6-dideoxygalactose transaminase
MGAARVKRSFEDLAISGGQPLFEKPLHVGCPNILDPDDFYARVRQAVERKWLSNDGPFLMEFERRFAEFLDTNHCIAVANATLGLQLVVRALGIKGKVLMPSFTFIATAHAVQWEGATPVFCDVLEDNHTLDFRKVREAMSDEVGAIVGVHLWGGTCEIDELQEIADEWGVPLIFDAAHALGSSYNGEKLGRFGKAEIFSLHATKGINGIEAGFITTQDDELAKRLRAMRNYGFDGNGVVGELGINAKMHEVSAAMALSNLPHYPRLADHNRRLNAAYGRVFARVPEVQIYSHQTPASNEHYAVFGLRHPDPNARDRLIRILEAENVLARRYFSPGCHRTMPYSQHTQPDLRITDRVSNSVFQLPTGLQLEERDAEAIAECVVLGIELISK